MTINLFSFVDLYRRALDTTAHLLTKGADYAAAHEVSETEMLDWRLVDDMAPLRFQVMVVVNFSKQWTARVADLPVPDDIGTELSLTEFQAAIVEAKQYLAALTPEQFAGRDEVPLTVSIASGAMEPTLPAGQWLTVFSTTNLHFHLSTAYGILRAHGVQIGKADLFASGL